MSISLTEAEQLIREFDSDLDGRLTEAEFFSFILPATSLSLRDIALKRNNVQSYSYRYLPLHHSTHQQIGSLIMKELRYLASRDSLRKDVINHYDYLRSRYFNLLSRGKEFITVDDIISFLDINSFRAYTVDIEAILRRFDHSGDMLLSYSEFSELVSLHNAPLSSSIGAGSASGSPARSSPQALRVTHRQSSSPQPNNSRVENEQLDRIGTFGPIASEAKEEGAGDAPLFCGRIGPEKVQKEEEKGIFCGRLGPERAGSPQVDNEEGPKNQSSHGEAEPEEDKQEEGVMPEEYRFLRVIKDQIRIDKKLEIQKEILNSNTSFNVMEAFRMFDPNGQGFITQQDMNEKLAELKVNAEAEKIFERFDRDGDGKLSYSEFRELLTPLNSEYSSYQPRRSGSQYSGSPGRFGSYNNSPAKSLKEREEGDNHRRTEWMDDLKEVLFIITRGEYMMQDIRNNLNVDSAAIFGQIDSLNLGYITITKLMDWLSEEVGFTLNSTERQLIQNRYGRRSRYEITAAEFMDQVQAIPQAEEEENPENEDLMDGRDSDAYMGGEERNQEDDLKNIPSGIEDSAEEHPVMKGMYNNAGGEGDASATIQPDNEDESPAAGSESH